MMKFLIAYIGLSASPPKKKIGAHLIASPWAPKTLVNHWQLDTLGPLGFTILAVSVIRASVCLKIQLS